MELDVRGVQSSQASELYITASPDRALPPAEQGRQVFAAIGQLLRSRGARLFHERIFAGRAAIEGLRKVRAEAYGDLDDAVVPSWLVAPGESGITAVQVHAVSGVSGPKPLGVNGTLRARTVEMNGCRWVSASALCAREAGDARSQARASFEKAEAILRLAGADMRNVARTWIFMDDILGWYGQFNAARTGFFLERGVVGMTAAENRMPASTGIGVSPACGGKCLMDLMAVAGPKDAVQRYHAAGKQKSAYEYGSAFARASQAKTPAGRTVYVSGTAAIDTAGRTCFVGDAAGQIRMTLENVVAVLREMECGKEDVVQAIAYCASPAVRDAFLGEWAGSLPWPWVTLIGDVCRADLLFEVEVTACAGAKSML